nr:guanine nucleotide-binding protein-like NSN1 [Tanacetum cinerariifolium]
MADLSKKVFASEKRFEEGNVKDDFEKMVMRAGPEKHLVLLLNKIDLVPREAAEKWLKYLREELPA